MTVAVVTGSSTGIGYATALRLAADGHRVIATMRNPAACDLAEVAKQRDLDVDVRPLDVNDDESVGVLFKDVGDVDVLVNNAGLGGTEALEETDVDSFRAVMETNFFGALRCAKAVLPSMRERGSGCILNVSSVSGRVAAPSMSSYAASKWALEAAMEALAVEVAPFGIRVALIEPGVIMTPIWSKTDMTPPTGPYERIRKRLGRSLMEEMPHASPAEEVADCIAEAITAEPPRLRWLVGRGAERMVANRASMTDEQWIGLWSGPIEEFKTRYYADPAR